MPERHSLNWPQELSRSPLSRCGPSSASISDRTRYELQFAPKAIRSLRKLDHAAVRRVRETAEALRDNPRPAGALMLTGMHGVLRIRTGDYRILYTVDDGQLMILVVDTGHRRDIYGR